MQRFTGVLGLVVILAVAWLFSTHKKEIKLRLILWGMGLQFAFALLVLKTNFGQLDKKNITIYDAKTLQPIDQIDVPGIVVESILSPDGKILYVSNFKRSSVMAIESR